MLCPLSRFGQFRLRVNRHQAHFVHQAFDPFMVYLVAFILQTGRDLAYPEVRSIRINFINAPHQFQIQFADRARLVVVAGPCQFQQFTLTANADLRIIRLDQSPFLLK